MSRPDQGAISALWASVAPDARSEEYENGSYFTEAKEKGEETEEARDQEVSAWFAQWVAWTWLTILVRFS
jgi:hypothetical protein